MSINVDAVVLEEELESLRILFHELRYCSGDQTEFVDDLITARAKLEEKFQPRALPF